jgi:DNA topoisomerase-1
MHVLAGDCTTVYEGDRPYEKRGRVVCVCKPDDTVLVHDAAGYQPVAWLTRPETTTVRDPDDPDGPTVEARDGDAVLRVFVHEAHDPGEFDASAAGRPVGACPDCEGTLVRSSGAVACTGCEVRHGLPAGAAVLEEACDCGLPRVRAVRGHPFEVCLDPGCDPLVGKVADAFDEEWDCPECGAPLRVRTPDRGSRPFMGCSGYPGCTASFGLPRGELAGTCDCGAPAFRVDGDVTCLSCE